jgi:serine/threonine-protein kinase RsbW
MGRLSAFGEVRAWAEAFGAAVGADRSAVLRLVLVLEELFTNTVLHGYRAEAEGMVWVTLANRDRGIEVTYEDAARPFDPLGEVPSPPVDRPEGEKAVPGGLGLALVRGLTASARYARVDGRNRVTLTVPPENTASPPPPRAG